MTKIITFDPTIRGYNPCAIFYFANTAFLPGDNVVNDTVFDGMTAHPDWADYILDGTFSTTAPVTNLIPYFSSPYTGILESDIDPAQVIANTIAIQNLQLQAHDPVTPGNPSLIEDSIVEQEFCVQLSGLVNNILTIENDGLYATSNLSWTWMAGLRAKIQTSCSFRTYDGIPSDQNPFVAFSDSTIRKVIVVNDPDDNSSSWEGVVFVNGIEVYSLTNPAGAYKVISPDINIIIDQGDEVVVCFRNATAPIPKPGIQILVSER